MRIAGVFLSGLLTLAAAAVSCSSPPPHRIAPSSSATTSGDVTTGTTGHDAGRGGEAGKGGSGGASGQGGAAGKHPFYDGGTDAADPCKGCPFDEYCGYADSLCGKGLKKPVCLPVMNSAACTPPTPACGCDGKVYASRCAAGQVDVDIDESGGCAPPTGHFACGGIFCKVQDQYCRLRSGAASGPPVCAGPPMTCGMMMVHDGGAAGAAPGSDLTCACVKAGDPQCPDCTGTPATGITASGCQ